jgi:hypothetical protein
MFANGQSNVHYLLSFLFWYRKFSAGDVLETNDLCELSAKNRFVKSECFFGISIEVDQGLIVLMIFILLVRIFCEG